MAETISMLLPDDGWGLEGWVASKSSSSPRSVSRLEARPGTRAAIRALFLSYDYQGLAKCGIKASSGRKDSSWEMEFCTEKTGLRLPRAPGPSGRVWTLQRTEGRFDDAQPTK